MVACCSCPWTQRSQSAFVDHAETCVSRRHLRDQPYADHGTAHSFAHRFRTRLESASAKNFLCLRPVRGLQQEILKELRPVRSRIFLRTGVAFLRIGVACSCCIALVTFLIRTSVTSSLSDSASGNYASNLFIVIFIIKSILFK